MENNARSIICRYPHLPFVVYLLFAAAFLGIQMCQGFSWLDIGMYMSGAEHFNSDPYASYFLGQWILTYDLTGMLCRLFSVDSFMGLRVMHLVYVLLTQIIVYVYLIRYISRRHVILGLLLVTLAHFGSYTEINYNDYSAFLLMLSLMAFHEGAMRSRWMLVAVAGLVAGVAVFFRIVNITYAAIPLFSCLLSLRWHVAMKAWRRLLFFYIGMAAGMAAVVAMLYWQGLLDPLRLTVADIAGISSDSGDPHGMLYVMRSLYNLYGYIVSNAVYILLAWLIAVAAWRLKGAVRRYGVLFVAFLLMMLMMNFSYFPSNVTMAVCVMGCLVLYFRNQVSPECAHLYMMSLFMPLVMPAGSNAEPSFYGKELCFFALPLSLSLLLSAVRPTIPNGSSAVSKFGGIRPLMSVYAMVAIGFIGFNVVHKQMEDGNRLSCRYTIDSPLARGILTTADNAEMYNYLLQKLRPQVASGSYMICQFSLPMVSLMECRPWAVYSTVYSTDRMNDRYIAAAWQHTRSLPYVLLDKESELPGYTHILEQLSKIRPYHKAWTDGRYELYAPAPTPTLPKGGRMDSSWENK